MNTKSILFALALSVILSFVGCRGAPPESPTDKLWRGLDSNDNSLIAEGIRLGADVNLVDKNHRLPLHFAIKQINLGAVALLLNAGAQVNSYYPDGSSLLNAAIERKDTPLIKLLLENGANVKGPDFAGRLPLNLAVTSKNLDVIELLLRRLARSDSKDTKGRTAMSLALDIYYQKPSSDTKILEWFLDTSSEWRTSYKNNLPLIDTAITYNSLSLVKRLLEKGAIFAKETVQAYFDSNAVKNEMLMLLARYGDIANLTRSSSGEPILFWALSRGYADLASLLLAKGANVNAPINSKTKETINKWAQTQTNGSIKNMFAKFDTPSDKLWRALELGDDALVQQAIKIGAKVNEDNPSLTLPLNYAVRKKHLKLVTSLLKGGAKPILKDSKGKTALEEVNPSDLDKADVIQIVEMLLRADANPNTLLLGSPILSLAIDSNKLSLAKLLFEKGSRLDPKAAQSYLDKFKNQTLEMMQLLVENGANPNLLRTSDKEPILYWAAKNNFYSLARLLLAKGANPNQQISNYKWDSSVIFWVYKNGDKPLKELFSKYSTSGFGYEGQHDNKREEPKKETPKPEKPKQEEAKTERPKQQIGPEFKLIRETPDVETCLATFAMSDPQITRNAFASKKRTTLKQIKLAHRALQRKYHADKCDTEACKKLSLWINDCRDCLDPRNLDADKCDESPGVPHQKHRPFGW